MPWLRLRLRLRLRWRLHRLLLLTIVMALMGLLLTELLAVFRRSGHGPLSAVPLVWIVHVVTVLSYVNRVAESVLRYLGSSSGLSVFRGVRSVARFLPMVLTPFRFTVRADRTGPAGGAASARLRPRVFVRVPLIIVVLTVPGVTAVSSAERTVERYVAPGRADQVIREFWVPGS